MENYIVKKIGIIVHDETGTKILLDKKYTPALEGLDGFSHLNILWWFSQCDDDTSRETLQEQAPYKNGPDVLGTFATRSPLRPNPIALSCAQVLSIDKDNATIEIAHIDAHHNSPVLDMKPYTPSLDRVEQAATPAWCSHWPKSIEESGSFDWSSEFNFPETK